MQRSFANRTDCSSYSRLRDEQCVYFDAVWLPHHLPLVLPRLRRMHAYGGGCITDGCR